MDLYYIGENAEYVVTLMNSKKCDEDFYIYAQNFHEAAEYVNYFLITQAAQNREKSKLDLWYFAMAYLYRQSLELLLKASIIQKVIENDERKRIIKEIGHNLKCAINKLIKIKNLNTENNPNAKWLLDLLTDISQIDGNSYVFRYPLGNKFNTLFEKQTNVSLLKTRDNMNKAYKIIKSVFDSGKFLEETYEADLPELLIENDSYYQQSSVGYRTSNFSFHPYFSSYWEVGNFLRNTILNEKRLNLFIPMCCLYRNAIELGIKRIIIEDSCLNPVDALNKAWRKKHNLNELWKMINKYTNISDDPVILDETKNFVEIFSKIDKMYGWFCFPYDIDFNSYFPEEKKFDTDNISSCFEELCGFLDRLNSQLDYKKEYETEINSYYE